MASTVTALERTAIEAALKTLSGWQYTDQALERVYTGKTYLEALDKLNAIAQLSEAQDHHPDLTLNWKKLTIRYWTHTAQGVTELDVKLAQLAEAALNQ